ncbi:glycosyltransferase family A protein [Paracoccus sp. 1_MG-2023]|uniref:glycosyltransferase family 2 protein n=1 Tax=unclassified Paracoccus (in: a-proteobacteria) TaxID=2688777 RepID=UPI001C0A2B94|nr:MULTISPECIES: glycosyltransferase family A protein [unclassified Paracoccus (in: a-proteobacteria)]MBU2956260.1 glycosyltransferase family 2 protein [Paracoccus sp. C2R09]MDO6667937.1 glycosyltransferase family A protein [Paracoccus sp. 1_MG-2023]
MQQDAQPDLAIVIPVRNLPEDLDRLLGQIAALGIFSQVVVSDDCSDAECSPRLSGNLARLSGVDVVHLRSDRQRGAGHARNMGLAAVTASNVLFFDADDMLCDELAEIWRHHQEAGCPDFTIFRHSDTRVEESEGRRGTFPTEEQMWERALSGDSRRMLSAQECAGLVMISAYPWNKIYRTDFLRSHDISCSETPVHNDIRLHWLSFLHARDVQASRRIGAVHVIGDREHHLTARKGRERLCLAGIVAELTDRIREAPGRQIMMQRFIQFVDGICRWNLRQVEDDLIPEFRSLACDAYLGFTPEEFRMFAMQQPDRAQEIVRFLLAEGV